MTETVSIQDLQDLQKAKQAGELFTIGALAAQCGVTVRTLRYYEEMDLIGPVKRTEGKYRLYNRHSLKRVTAILALQDLGYTLEEILLTLGAYSKRREYTKQEQLEATRQSLSLQKNCIDGKLKQLKTMKRDIQQRLEILETVCEPCVDCRPAETSCPENCEYLDAHD